MIEISRSDRYGPGWELASDDARHGAIAREVVSAFERYSPDALARDVAAVIRVAEGRGL